MKTRHACELTMSWVRSKREPLFIANMQTTHMCEPSMSGACPRLDDLGTVFKCSPHKFRIFTNPSPFSTLGTYTQYILCPLFSYPFSPSQCWHHLSMAPWYHDRSVPHVSICLKMGHITPIYAPFMPYFKTYGDMRHGSVTIAFFILWQIREERGGQGWRRPSQQ